jgi:hypothetical protein
MAELLFAIFATPVALAIVKTLLRLTDKRLEEPAIEETGLRQR